MRAVQVTTLGRGQRQTRDIYFVDVHETVEHTKRYFHLSRFAIIEPAPTSGFCWAVARLTAIRARRPQGTLIH